jgi:hypothetical protein
MAKSREGPLVPVPKRQLLRAHACKAKRARMTLVSHVLPKLQAEREPQVQRGLEALALQEQLEVEFRDPAFEGFQNINRLDVPSLGVVPLKIDELRKEIFTLSKCLYYADKKASKLIKYCIMSCRAKIERLQASRVKLPFPKEETS